MLARLHSVTLVGIDALPCEVEVNVASRGFATSTIVGLPDAAVTESLDRIHTAITNCGYLAPEKRTVINLAPADIRKEGPALDLPIALGTVFAAEGAVPEGVERYVIAGELALDGRVRPVRGALSMAMLARQRGCDGIVLPAANAAEAAVVDGVGVYSVGSLTEAVGFLTGQLTIEPTQVDVEAAFARASRCDIDFSDVRGQEFAKRALTIAAADGHNVLVIGPSASSRLTPHQSRAYSVWRSLTTLPPSFQAARMTLDTPTTGVEVAAAEGSARPPRCALPAHGVCSEPSRSNIEAGLNRGGRSKLFGKNLDRHFAIQPRIPCSIDLAHAARSEGREYLVGT